MKIDSVHAEFMSGNAVSSTTSSHSIVSRDASGDIAVAGVSIVGNPGTLFSYSDGTRSVYGGCNASDPWFGTNSNYDLRLVTNSSEQMRIDKTGNVGIGTTNPSAGKLDIFVPDGGTGIHIRGGDYATNNGEAHIRIGGGGSEADNISHHATITGGHTSSGSSYLSFSTLLDYNTHGNSPVERMRILNNGNVGINDASPSYKLSVNGSFRVHGNIATFGSDGLLHINSRTTTHGSETVALQTTIDGRALSEDDPGTHGGESRNVLALQPDGGYVGIGTTSPGYKLHVDGSSMFENTVNIVNNDTSAYASLEMGGTVGAYIDLKKPSSDDYDFRLITTGSGGSIQIAGGGDAMTFLSDGKVGIGDSTPSYKLDVNGDINVASGKKFRINGTALANSATITADDANANNTIVLRSSTGNFSAGTITATLSGNADTATNADKLDGVHLDNIFNNMGDAHNNRSNFNSVPDAGCYYITGNTNGPGVNGASQFYGFTLGLGGHDPVASGSNNGKYGCQIYWGRNVSNPYINVRYLENGSWGGWNKAAAGYADSAGSATTATSATSAGNADTVDSLHAHQFLRSDASDTCSGTLYVSGGAWHNNLGWVAWRALYNGQTVLYADDQELQFYVSIRGANAIRASSMVVTSDERVKTEIQTLDPEIALSKLEKIRPVSYKMKETGQFTFGFIGQEIEKELPNVVNKSDGTLVDFNIMGEFSNKQSIKYQFAGEEKDMFIYTLTLENPIPSTFDVDKVVAISASSVTGNTSDFLYDPEYCGKPEIGGTVMKLLHERELTEEGRYKIIGTETDDFRSLDYNEIFTVTTAALKEVNEQLKAEKIKTADLTARVEELEAMVSIIKLNMTWPDA